MRWCEQGANTFSTPALGTKRGAQCPRCLPLQRGPVEVEAGRVAEDRRHEATRPETLTDIQRAARFYYLMQNCFSGKLEGQTFGTATTAPPGLNLLRLEETLSAAHLRLARIYVEHLPWLDCVRRYDRPHTLFYLDPPYWGTAGYGVDFGTEEYAAMAEVMRTMKGRALVSVNDHPKMHEAFAGFHMQVLDIRYTVGGGAGVPRAELLIQNWPD
ncbi:hypothetical protein L7Q78_28570 [Achromobacter xylosoxidans]|nr:hypothetical protein [Achromobacter xylosoxidans]